MAVLDFSVRAAGVPSATYIHNVLSKEECTRLVELSKKMMYGDRRRYIDLEVVGI